MLDALSQIVNVLAVVKPDDYEALKKRLLQNASHCDRRSRQIRCPATWAHDMPCRQRLRQIRRVSGQSFTRICEAPHKTVCRREKGSRLHEDVHWKRGYGSRIQRLSKSKKTTSESLAEESYWLAIKIFGCRVAKCGSGSHTTKRGPQSVRIGRQESIRTQSCSASNDSIRAFCISMPVLSNLSTLNLSVAVDKCLSPKPRRWGYEGLLNKGWETQAKLSWMSDHMWLFSADRIWPGVSSARDCDSGWMDALSVSLPGGWRMRSTQSQMPTNIFVKKLVHSQMLMARHGLPGHDVYNCVRNADESQSVDGQEEPSSKEEMLEWLAEWKGGDKVTHGPPGLWDISKLNVPGVEYFEELAYLFYKSTRLSKLSSTEDFDPNDSWMRMDLHHYIWHALWARNKLWKYCYVAIKWMSTKAIRMETHHYKLRAYMARNKLWKYCYVAIKWMSTKAISMERHHYILRAQGRGTSCGSTFT